MERDNFYIILDLSTSPPENDPVKIEEAIKKKQAEWSRLRNHPSKGINAQKYIGLLPEIRKVMLDPALRAKEARNAQEIARSQKADKFTGIDRHLELLMNKGFIKEEEIVKLAKIHKVPPNEIRSRIQAKEKEKYTELDKQIQNRMNKGFISEAEISSLAKIHGMDEKDVRSRVSGPIKKESKFNLRKTKALDPSIVKIIEDNLKVVGKASLYDFLGMSPDSDLADLQQKAREKESEVLKSRKKDAVATASGVLVGHCISQFKNERNKASYDATRAQSHLSELDSDIDVAGIEGVIRKDNFAFLVNRAVEFGMDPDEAVKYIRNYCKEKKWKIETAKKPKTKKTGKQLLFRLAVLIVFVAAGYFQGSRLYDDYKGKKDFERIVAKAESLPELEDRIGLLRQYLNEHDIHKYTPEISKKYEEYKARREARRIDDLIVSAKDLVREEKFEEAVTVFKQYLEKNPRSPSIMRLRKEISALEKLIEKRDYETLANIEHLSVAERIAAYSRYLKQHPSGEGRENVLNILQELGDAYFVTLMDELDQCEKQKRYEVCAALAENFIEAFPDDERSEKLRLFQHRYRQKLNEELALEELIRKAAEKGPDYSAARKLFDSYLEFNPTSPIKDRVLEEIEKVEKKRVQAEFAAELERRMQLLEATGGRFVPKMDNVVSDTRTGLMWAMWDSSHSTEDCMDYHKAEQYVDSLHIGGYDDWRIPTPEELAGIYKSEPFFPFNDAPWYWSSVSYKSYSDGWIFLVDVVDTKKTTVYRKEQIDSRKCGAVRAVRP